MPMMMMGGAEFAGWFELAGKGAGIQTFHGYGNGAQLAPQIAKAGRENVFVSTGIPCGCCGSDGPKVKPVTFAEATGYIADELSQLNTTYADLLLFHHRCDTAAETAAVWSALEAAKAAGKARHIGVSNFNTNDLQTLAKTAKQVSENGHLYIKTIFLPRQARDKHRETSRKKYRFVAQPVEVLEAHFGVGIFDFEVHEYARQHNIHPVRETSI